jgi:multidrug efflux pump
VFPIEHELNMKLAGITGVRAPVFLPPALPNPGLFPVEVVLSSTAEHAQLVSTPTSWCRRRWRASSSRSRPSSTSASTRPTEIVIDRSKAASMG